MKLIYFFLLSVFLTSCGKFTGTNTSIWAGALWVIPGVTFLASLWFFYRAWKKSKSGGERQLPGGGYVPAEPLPFYKQNVFIFAVGLLLATIGIIVWQNLEK